MLSHSPLSQRPTLHSRRTRRQIATPNPLITGLSIGAVVLILAVTFLGDLLRTPRLLLSAPHLIFSPNEDGINDIFVLNYRLLDDARVVVQVFSGDSMIRTVADLPNQSAGNYFVHWDGRTDQGFLVEDGSYRLQVTARGALYATTQSLMTQVDIQPPPLQLVNLNDSMHVNQETLVIEGITEPGATVWISGNPQPMTADPGGRFRSGYRLSEGPNVVEIKVTDVAGNTTRLERLVYLETQPPEILLTRPLENEWLNNPLVTVEGKTHPEAKVTINRQNVQVNDDGTFSHQLLLEEGSNVLRIVAEDPVGNLATLERVVYVKTTLSPVQLSIADGTIVSDPNFLLVGRTDPGNLVTVNGAPLTVSLLGDFQYQTTLNTGENLLTVQVRDQAGNTHTVTRRVIYNPPAPLDNLTRITKNLDFLPAFLIPSFLLTLGILAILYVRQNRVSLSLSVDQPIFSPGLPNQEKNLTIFLDLSKTARVSIEVVDARGYPRATILSNRRKLGRKHVFYWNGYDDYGRLVEPGEYFIQVEAGSPPLQVSSAVPVRVERKVPSAQAPVTVGQQSGTNISRTSG